MENWKIYREDEIPKDVYIGDISYVEDNNPVIKLENWHNGRIINYIKLEFKNMYSVRVFEEGMALNKIFEDIMKFKPDCTLSEYLSQSRFKMRLQRRERDRTGKAEITRDRANLTETILRVCDSNNEKNGQNFISVFEVMKNKRIIG